MSSSLLCCILLLSLASVVLYKAIDNVYSPFYPKESRESIAHLHKQSIVELLVDELTVFFDLLLMFFLLHHVLIVDRFFFQLLHVVLVLLLLLLINFV